MKKVTASGKTVDEAIQKALEELNATEDQVHIQVLENPQKGFFGLFGGKPAIVEMELKLDAVEQARTFLEELIQKMGIEANVIKREEKTKTIFELQSNQIGMLIGKRGQTLDSLQFLTNLVVNRYSEKYTRIQLDAENYRDKRKQSLQQLAQRLAKKVLSTNKMVKLEPMSAFERKVIHSTLQGQDGIKTYSEGEEPKRYIVISPK